MIVAALRWGRMLHLLLMTTDGFVYYRRVVKRDVSYGCVYGQAKKTWRTNRVVKVDRVLAIGSDWQLDEALSLSEDSTWLNTAFVERLKLTLRQGCAYLNRRPRAIPGATNGWRIRLSCFVAATTSCGLIVR